METFQFHSEQAGTAQRITLTRGQRPVPFADVLDHWRDDPDFRTMFCELLAESPFNAFRWETPPLTTANANRDFEFVLLRCDRLDRPPDPAAFSRHYTQENVVTFPNLGGDAVLVVPRPLSAASQYSHLAAFLREAPAAQRHLLWQTVAAAMHQRIGTQPIWLNTAGMGVSWLHIRLDSQPKYYGYEPYTHSP